MAKKIAKKKREKIGSMISVRLSFELHAEMDDFRKENGEYNWSGYIKQCIIEKLEEEKNAKQSTQN